VNTASGDLSSPPGAERHARFALMQDEHPPCALTNDEVTLPVAALGSAVDSLGPGISGAPSRSKWFKSAIDTSWGSQGKQPARCSMQRLMDTACRVFAL
jgi:hypothetical protein